MATANHEVKQCKCNHGSHQHEAPKAMGLLPGECQVCPCTAFEPKAVHLKEGEQQRRITED